MSPHARRLCLLFTFLFVAMPLALTAQDVKITHSSLKVGDAAPDFTLLDNHWKPVRLSDYRGKKNVVLAFYVLAFSDT